MENLPVELYRRVTLMGPKAVVLGKLVDSARSGTHLAYIYDGLVPGESGVNSSIHLTGYDGVVEG